MAHTERFGDIAVTQLNTEGFEKLNDKQKNLAYYLGQAGLWGRFISLDQGCEHNVNMFKTLIALRKLVSEGSEVYSQVHNSLLMMFAHNGVYHSTTGEKLELPLNQNSLTAFKVEAPELVQYLEDMWFSGAIRQWRTVQKDGVDVVAESGGNFYKGLTTDDVKEWRKKNYPQMQGNEVPPFGFNERLYKDAEGNIVREVISVNGLYGEYVRKIVENLESALEFAENEKQLKSLQTLIDFYYSGDAKDFDKHCVAWVEDKDSSIYYINGLIESYDDPLGIGCGFESIVAFKNPIQTAKVEKIIEHIQWFENNMPFDDKFKKEKAVGLSASSVSVISMAGETSPTLPLGINLPNSDWIRGKHGSKSVNLENSASSRSSFEGGLRQAMYLPKYHALMEKNLNLTNGLHTDLHEIAGHGSGKVLDGVNTDVLGEFYSIIEECRADLVALYFMSDEKLQDFGIYDKSVNVPEAAMAQYVAYLSNGAFGQLRRIQSGDELTQAHFRNRQLIALWVLEHADKSKVSLVEKDGNVFVEVNDIGHVKDLFGQLLYKIQAIKSTGDFEQARNLVMTYGTKINKEYQKQIHQRVSMLGMPNTVCFMTPVLTKVGETVQLSQVEGFYEQQEKLFQGFCSLEVDIEPTMSANKKMKM